MATPARTPARGLPGPGWPPRPVPPTVPTAIEDSGTRVGPGGRAAQGGTSATPRPGRDSPVGAPPAPQAVPEPVVDVPPEEQVLDPRGIARASLAAGRNRSLWWTLTGIVAAVVVTFVGDAVVGALTLAALLLVYAVVRACGRPPGPVAVSVRSKPVDVAILVLGAAALVVLATVLPATG